MLAAIGSLPIARIRPTYGKQMPRSPLAHRICAAGPSCTSLGVGKPQAHSSIQHHHALHSAKQQNVGGATPTLTTVAPLRGPHGYMLCSQKLGEAICFPSIGAPQSLLSPHVGAGPMLLLDHSGDMPYSSCLENATPAPSRQSCKRPRSPSAKFASRSPVPLLLEDHGPLAEMSDFASFSDCNSDTNEGAHNKGKTDNVDPASAAERFKCVFLPAFSEVVL